MDSKVHDDGDVLPVRRGFAHEPMVLVRGLGGAAIGAVAGYLLFRWLISQGFYSIMIPAVCLGLAAGFAARGASQLLGVLCAALALVLMIYAEWSSRPFAADKSLSFFLAHLHELSTITLVMFGLGTAFAYWFGRGRTRGSG